MSSVKCAIGLAVAGLFAACAHRGADKASMDELNRNIESLRNQNAEYAKQVEELENRVFILTDQLESRKVNEQKVASPLLPTVKLHPEADPASPGIPSALMPATTMVAPDSEVEYAGEATKSNRDRPVLRLHGDRSSSQMERPTAEIEERAPRVPREASGPSRPSRTSDSEAISLYRQSYQTLRQGRHDEAAEGFREFLRRYATHDLADNAQYWLGECAYDRKDFSTAVREFRRVVERFPHGNKVPDALLKIGFCYLSLGSLDAGKQTLEQLVRSYPRHETSVLANARLAELDRAGAARPSPSADQPAKTAHAPEEAP
ncbi:MAG TPA: tol-pal system protein YbgF [Polyangia bacterium]